MVPNERDFQVNAKISTAAAQRLKKLSVRRGQSYGEVLDTLLLEVPIEQAEWEQPLNDALSRIALLESQVSALLSLSKTETLLSIAAVVKQDTRGLDEPELACLSDVPPSAQGGDLGASEGQGIDEPGQAGITPENASQGVVGRMEKEGLSFSILSNESPAKRSVKEFIADLVANGERSPTVIARALNSAGYRTGARSEFQRSNPQIKAALDQVKDK